MQVGPWSQTRDVPRIQMRIQSLKPVGRTIFTVYTEAILLEKNTIVARVCFSLRKGSEAYASLSKHCSWNRGGAGGGLCGPAKYVCPSVRRQFFGLFFIFFIFQFSFFQFFPVLRQKGGPFTFRWIPIRVGVDFLGDFYSWEGNTVLFSQDGVVDFCNSLSRHCGGFLSQHWSSN